MPKIEVGYNSDGLVTLAIEYDSGEKVIPLTMREAFDLSRLLNSAVEKVATEQPITLILPEGIR